jgi:hypothetical protein
MLKPFKTYVKESLDDSDDSDYLSESKESLLGKVVYHGTCLEQWNPSTKKELYVTEFLSDAKNYADEAASSYALQNNKKISTSVVFEIIVDKEIMG